MARRWHLLTAVVAGGALLLQLVLIVDGQAVLAETDPPGLATRLGRFVSYFTIQSNLLVLVTSASLARDPARDGPVWRVVRLAAVVGIAVTGVTHFFLLRPLLDLEGWNWVADRMLHMVVPLAAVVGWLAFGPRPRLYGGEVLRAFAWPLAWLGYTLAVGAASGWYPYPFLDPDEDGWGRVMLSAAGVTLVFLVFFAVASVVDRRLKPAPG